jgi:acyl-CoA synthetase (AMP-forming)/AMP-acid ligase II
MLACKKHLPKYHQPKQIFEVKAFELTKSGKIDRIKTKDKVLHGKR